MRSAPTGRDRGGSAQSIAFSPDGLRIAATIGDGYRTGELIVCDVASGKIRKLGQASTGVTFSPDGTRIAAWIGSISQTAEVGLWDVVTGRQVLVLKGHAGHTLARGIAFLPGGDRMLSVAQLTSPTRPLEVKTWDARRGREHPTADEGSGWRTDTRLSLQAGRDRISRRDALGQFFENRSHHAPAVAGAAPCSRR